MTQAIILCAGKSTRTYPLTLTRPKALLPIANKPLLEYNLDSLDGHVQEVVLIVGYRKEDIMEHFGRKYKNLKIRYVEQRELLGTGHALLQAKEFITEKVIVINGDDIYSPEDIKKMLQVECGILCKKVDDPSRFGVVLTKGNKAEKIVEKPKEFIGNLANIGVYTFPKNIAAILEKIKKSPRQEYEITDAIELLSKQQEVIAVETAGYFLSIGFPWDILSANSYLLDTIKKASIKGEVEKGATIKGNVIIGEGTIIRAGSYISGPVIIGNNCTIGPNCYIRSHTAIGDDCKIGNAVEVKESVLIKSVSIGHLSYVGDSVIGEGVNFGAGTITANLRHDEKPVSFMHNEKRVDSGRRKLGAVVGDGVHTGIHTSIYPGRKLWPRATTLPGEIVSKDKVV